MHEGKKILLLDEKSGLRKALASHFDRKGFQVIQAANAESAIEIAEDINPDLIMIDVQITGMPWFDFWDRLRQTRFGNNVPLMLFVPREAIQHFSRLRRTAAIMTVPFDFKEVEEKVQELLSKGKYWKRRFQKVLMIGNDEKQMKMIRYVLDQEGVEVLSVTTGPEAITKVVNQAVDLVFLDLLIDGMPSFEIIHIFRQMPQAKTVPVIVFSYYCLSELGAEDGHSKALKIDAIRRRCLRAGVTEDLGELQEPKIRKIVKKYFK